MHDSNVTDCTIIGGGPAGLYASFYAGMRDMSVRLIEIRKSLGGKLHFYPEKKIWDIGGMLPTHGLDVMNQLIEQSNTFEPEIILDTKIINIEKINEHLFKVVSSDGESYYSRSVVIATGGGLVYPRKLKSDQAKAYENTNLHYTIYRLNDFKNKKVVIVGGGNSAIDWANELADTVAELHLIHRNDTFKAHESQLRKLKESNVQIHSYTSIEKLVPTESTGRIQAIELKNSQSQTAYQLPLDDLIVNIGFDFEANFHQTEGHELSLKDNFYIEANTMTHTSVEGIYAIGDIVDYVGKVRLIAGAFHDAVNAVNEIKASISSQETKQIVMSSLHKGLQNRSLKD